jgi:pimeloyl-ACP methyl ester carboxylesterase
MWAWEPPYLGILPDAGDLGALGERITTIAHTSGLADAALAFLATVEGQAVVDRLPEALRAMFATEGRGAVADAALLGFDPGGLETIGIPVGIGIGGRDGGPYAAVAQALARRITTLEVQRMDGLGHGAPTRRPEIIADAIRTFELGAGLPHRHQEGPRA